MDERDISVQRQIFTVDRIEEGFCICIRDEDEQIFTLLPEKHISLTPQEVFSACVDGETLRDILPLPEETMRRKAEATARLERLFGKR